MSTNQAILWLQNIQTDNDDDLTLAKRVLDGLIGYSSYGLKQEKQDLATLIDVFTAIRIDQMSKEANS